jgi:hypothetical protein
MQHLMLLEAAVAENPGNTDNTDNPGVIERLRVNQGNPENTGR